MDGQMDRWTDGPQPDAFTMKYLTYSDIIAVASMLAKNYECVSHCIVLILEQQVE